MYTLIQKHSKKMIHHIFTISLMLLMVSCGGGGGNSQKTNSPSPTVQTNDLTIEFTGAGSGTVSSTSPVISCQSNCTQSLDESTNVTLQSTANSGSTFNGWSGACSGMGECSFNMSTNRTVTANFIIDSTPSVNDLNVTVTAGGTVTSDPVGIDCESDCSESYDSTTQVSLTATSDVGFTFDGWSGACSGTEDCSFDMSSDREITATFVADSGSSQNTLTVNVEGSGNVTSDPVGIDCGSDCTEDYDDNTVVTLTANPDNGFILDHWSGACNSNGACTVTLDIARTVTATFAAEGQTSILIENYSAPNDAFTLAEIPSGTNGNASGVTWHPGINQYLVIRNSSAIIYRYNTDFQYLGQIQIDGDGKDTEGISWVENNDVLVVSEDNSASKVVIDEFVTRVDRNDPSSQRYNIATQPASNAGLEGIATRKSTSSQLVRVYAVQEGEKTTTSTPTSKKIFQFDMPNPDPLTLLSYDDNLTVTEPWDAFDVFADRAGDLAGLVYDSRTDDLIFLSQTASKALQVNPETGAIISTLDLTGAPQYEGVTIGPNGELVFVSEPNWMRIYTQN